MSCHDEFEWSSKEQVRIHLFLDFGSERRLKQLRRDHGWLIYSFLFSMHLYRHRHKRIIIVALVRRESWTALATSRSEQVVECFVIYIEALPYVADEAQRRRGTKFF